jgi:chromosome partitioning protein
MVYNDSLMTHIIAISNQKGGVAKTTSCFALGACLAEKGLNTLLVDLDPQAHLSMAAGLDTDDLSLTLADLLAPDGGSLSPAEACHPTAMDGLHILPCDLRLANLERNLHERRDYEYLLKGILERMRVFSPEHHAATSQAYDYMLLDCPPSMGSLTLMALTAASLALIPVECEYFASRGLLRLLDVIRAVKDHTNPALSYSVFISLYDGRNLVSRKVLEQLQTYFETAIFETIIRVDTRLRESPMAGEPILVYAPRTRASEEYRMLATELIKHMEDADEL